MRVHTWSATLLSNGPTTSEDVRLTDPRHRPQQLSDDRSREGGAQRDDLHQLPRALPVAGLKSVEREGAGATRVWAAHQFCGRSAEELACHNAF